LGILVLVLLLLLLTPLLLLLQRMKKSNCEIKLIGINQNVGQGVL
jgi:hypothetical protein